MPRRTPLPLPLRRPRWLDPDGRRRRSILEKPALGQMPQNREREEERERTMRGRLPLSAFLVFSAFLPAFLCDLCVEALELSLGLLHIQLSALSTSSRATRIASRNTLISPM